MYKHKPYSNTKYCTLHFSYPWLSGCPKAKLVNSGISPVSQRSESVSGLYVRPVSLTKQSFSLNFSNSKYNGKTLKYSKLSSYKTLCPDI